jgi:hypothetical protein
MVTEVASQVTALRKYTHSPWHADAALAKHTSSPPAYATSNVETSSMVWPHGVHELPVGICFDQRPLPGTGSCSASLFDTLRALRLGSSKCSSTDTGPGRLGRVRSGKFPAIHIPRSAAGRPDIFHIQITPDLESKRTQWQSSRVLLTLCDSMHQSAANDPKVSPITPIVLVGYN